MLRYDTICVSLSERFPEVVKHAEDMDLPSVFYEASFVPMVKAALRAYGSELERCGGSRRREARMALRAQRERVEPFFAYLEEMAISPDAEVRSLLQVSVLESLADEKDVRALMQPFLGQETLKVYSNLRDYMNLT